jgi:hypothetical protein
VLAANYIQAARAAEGVPRPKHLYLLSAASSATVAERAGPTSITLSPERGFLYTPLDKHYRGTSSFAVGDAVRLSAMTATVETLTEDGRPQKVRFDFPDPPGRYLFLAYRDHRFVPLSLPDLTGSGASVTFPKEDIGKILAETFLGSR